MQHAIHIDSCSHGVQRAAAAGRVPAAEAHLLPALVSAHGPSCNAQGDGWCTRARDRPCRTCSMTMPGSKHNVNSSPDGDRCTTHKCLMRTGPSPHTETPSGAGPPKAHSSSPFLLCISVGMRQCMARQRGAMAQRRARARMRCCPSILPPCGLRPYCTCSGMAVVLCARAHTCAPSCMYRRRSHHTSTLFQTPVMALGCATPLAHCVAQRPAASFIQCSALCPAAHLTHGMANRSAAVA